MDQVDFQVFRFIDQCDGYSLIVPNLHGSEVTKLVIDDLYSVIQTTEIYRSARYDGVERQNNYRRI
jgi:hypothetical protein